MTHDSGEYAQHGTSRVRSPAYPAIGLEEAVAKAKTVWEKERSNRVPLDVLAGHLGYKSAVGPGGVTISALLKFGLLSDEGTGTARQARITERGRRIVLDSEDRRDLLREAALSPAIHKELWEKYGDELPSPETMRRYLLVERNFNERVVDDFIQEYIDTLDYASLRATIPSDARGMAAPGQSDSGGKGKLQEHPNRPRERTGMTVLSFQISDRLVEVAVAGGPLTKPEIGTLKAYLGIQETIAPEERTEPATTPEDDAESE